MARILSPLVTVLLFVVYRTVDFIVLGLNAGAPPQIPEWNQLAAAAVIGAIAAALTSLVKAPLGKLALTLAVPAILGPAFIVASVAMKNRAMIPAVESFYGFMTVEWTLVGLAVALTLWPILRRERMATAPASSHGSL